jgi:membrane protein insertase Oxa1/YidC/SpoIIIJ
VVWCPRHRVLAPERALHYRCHVQIVNGAKMQMIQPKLKVVQERMLEAQKEGRRDIMIALNNERKVRSRARVIV